LTELIRTNCPRDCYDGCGIVVERRGADQPLRVLGDPDHPVSRGRLCSKCAVAYNGVWQDDSARLQQPLRRTGAKGAGEFEPISWEVALGEIAAQLTAITRERGATSILHTHYSGTLSMLAYQFPGRFFKHLGASEVDPDSICNAAGHTAWQLLYGNSVMGFDPRTAKDSSCILVWGANPSHSAPHAHEHWLRESKAAVVVVDPVRTETALAADLHLQPRPGTDAALAFALLHALREIGAFDETFIANHLEGAEEVDADITQSTPEWAEQQTGVPAADIRKAAQLYALGPALLWCGQGLQRQPTGGNVMRAVGLLPAFTGNVGKPGAGFYYLNYTPLFAGMDMGYLAGAKIQPKADVGAAPESISHMDLAARLADTEDFAAFMVWNTNPVASAADQNALRAALARDDLFTVVVDCFATDTVRYADIVLPAAGFLEFDDLTYSYFHLLVGAQVKVREPAGVALPNQEIFRRLAAAMEFTEAALFESDAAIIEHLLAGTSFAGDFAALKQQGHFYIAPEPLQFFTDGVFPTPSGRIEVGSEQAEAIGLPRTPQPWVDTHTDASRLRLLTPASKWRLNDSYGNDPHLLAQAGPATVTLHPRDAERFAVKTGARVRLHNAAGELVLGVVVDELAPEGVAVSYKGRWPLFEPEGESASDGQQANVNVLHVPAKADMAGSSAVHGVQVELEVLAAVDKHL